MLSLPQIVANNDIKWGLDMENKKKGKFSKDIAISIISGILAILLIATDIYILKTQGIESIVVAAIVAFTAILMLIICVTTIMGEKSADNSGYEDIYKAQKASYLMIKENFTKLQERVEEIEQGGDLPAANEIIEAQKAMAKVTINRSKENTDALINSNAELMSRITDLEGKISDNNSLIIKEQQSILEETQKEIIESNSDIEKKIEQVNETIKGLQVNLANLEQTQRSLSMQQPMMMVQAMPMQMPNMPNIMTPQMQVMPNQQMPQQAQVMTEQMVPNPSSVPGAVSIPEQAFVPAEEPMDEGVKEVLEERAKVPTEPVIPAAESAKEQELAGQESISEAVAEPVPEPVIESEIVEETAAIQDSETVALEKPAPAAAPDENPNKKLSPEEIAAMFAGNTTGQAAAPVTESVSDSDTNPNKIMSPEEIEAMFAKM